MTLRRRRRWAVTGQAGAAIAGAMTLVLCAALLAPLAAGASSQGLAVAQAGAEEQDFTASPIYQWLQRNRSAAYWLAPVLMIVVAILPIPAEIPAAMNGMLFGAVVGLLVTWGGAIVGAQISYELARFFGGRLTQRFIRPAALAKLERMKGAEAPMLLMLRLTPVVAFTVVNWAAGLLQIRRSTFLWTTALGILPGAIAFTASGSAVAWLYDIHPAAVTATVAAVGGLFIARAWWKRRAALDDGPA